MVTDGILLQPEKEIEVFGSLLHVKEILLKVFETERGQVFAIEDVIETHLEYWRDTAGAHFSDGWGRVAQPIWEC